MQPSGRTTVSAVVGAYDAERWIGETVQAILDQTRPAEEVIVVDDGSSDGTAAELARFGRRIRVITRANGGCPAAFNTAFAAAQGDFVAICGADDVWEPDKLERQLAALAAHPQIDFAATGALNFGELEGPWEPHPPSGLVDSAAFLQTLYRRNIICASSVLLRRDLFRRLGPFVESVEGERFACDDYEYWMRCLAAGACFYYEPAALVRYRRHSANATRDKPWVHRSRLHVHERYRDDVADRRVARRVLAGDLAELARGELDGGDPLSARATFARSLRCSVSARSLAFCALLSLPRGTARRAILAATGAKRAVQALSRS
jgi:glycosyltransferase involved in cell wall biosynthesis